MCVWYGTGIVVCLLRKTNFQIVNGAIESFVYAIINQYESAHRPQQTLNVRTVSSSSSSSSSVYSPTFVPSSTYSILYSPSQVHSPILLSRFLIELNAHAKTYFIHEFISSGFTFPNAWCLALPVVIVDSICVSQYFFSFLFTQHFIHTIRRCRCFSFPLHIWLIVLIWSAQQRLFRRMWERKPGMRNKNGSCVQLCANWLINKSIINGHRRTNIHDLKRQ